MVSTRLPFEPKQLSDLRPEAQRRLIKCLFVSTNYGSLPHQIQLTTLYKFCLVNHLPEDEQNGCSNKHSVVDPEVIKGPRLERRVAVREDDEDHPDEANPGGVGLKPADIRELAAVEVLDFHSAPEAEVCYAHDDVVDNAPSGDKVDLRKLR
jgi:hypothetical protein